jgi:hypothetical protein
MKHIKEIACVTFIILLITGCTTNSKANKEDRFFRVDRGIYFDIYVDSQTGVEYAMSSTAYNSGTLTLLVNPDGTPLIWKGDEAEKAHHDDAPDSQ